MSSEEANLHFDKVLVVGKLFLAEVAVQEGGDGGRAAVDALLQRLGLVQLRRQLRPLRLQDFLEMKLLIRFSLVPYGGSVSWDLFRPNLMMNEVLNPIQLTELAMSEIYT